MEDEAPPSSATIAQHRRSIYMLGSTGRIVLASHHDRSHHHQQQSVSASKPSSNKQAEISTRHARHRRTQQRGPRNGEPRGQHQQRPGMYVGRHCTIQRRAGNNYGDAANGPKTDTRRVAGRGSEARACPRKVKHGGPPVRNIVRASYTADCRIEPRRAVP
ncbi:uncharacterized protein K452DRAFT_27493 [Aplosporella prunicola CBS 121167]|uniref:Uncharacterized protein n=1 Tax=Aplosporella prunicola CBS 121167 TaxID=1176127 RepID=A0A6A6BH01_9PEZI|nr:uncharacterized protein K452DRAFT_27493 [Aplosporella prunicola CBS 121167]KAF2142157.1 hypothetical protein K452DRAFT_27493 [Aplosporella prunicola CBS 121167]